MEKRYEQKLDLYYISSITYLVTLIVYAVITGTLIGERFEMIWRDPIVYLLAICAVLSIGALVITAVRDRKVVIREKELVFSTRFKERIIRADEIESIAFRRGSRGRLRQGVAERAAWIKLKEKRRRLWLRPSGFDEGSRMMKEIRKWAEHNGIVLRKRRSRNRKNK